MLFKRRTANSGQVPKGLARRVGRAAQRVANAFDEKSQLVSSELTPVPRVKDEEMQLGKVLGLGGFNVVRELTLTGKEGVYAIKHLKQEVVSKPKEFRIGAIDLAAEACLLKSLSHPNVITLHAVSERPIQDSYLDGGRYSLVLDRLQCTVSDKLKEWKAERIEQNLSVDSDAYQMQVKERVHSVALPVARALKYLHANHVIFRDIKPANVGFDLNGTVKLFDFGLAKEYHRERKLTGNTGSLKYMAPEVALSQFYGFKADIFSFGVILWELTSLEKPFEDIKSRAEYVKKVAFTNYRPEIGPRCGSLKIQRLIERCWDAETVGRPSICGVVAKLAADEKRVQVAEQPLNTAPAIEKADRVTEDSSIADAAPEKAADESPSDQDSAKYWINKMTNGIECQSCFGITTS